MAFCCVTMSLAPTYSAEPFLPTSDNEVLEELPRVFAADKDALRALHQRLKADPNDVSAAVELASRYVGLGNENGDPRYYGYARSALTNWWDAPVDDPAILLLRAKLNEKDHLYHLALPDLETLTEKEPKNVQAWVEIANINRVIGNYADARHACGELSRFASDLEIMVCSIPIQAVTGNAEQAYRTLREASPRVQETFPNVTPWMHATLGQISYSLGNLEEAESHFVAGLQSNLGNKYLLRTYADLLLDQGRSTQVVDLLTPHIKDNGVLLRAAIAAQQSGQQDVADKWKSELATRFEEIRLRDSSPHGRYESRFVLEFEANPRLALDIALTNWQQQKELRDTRNALEAALEAEDRTAAQPVIDFIRENRTEDKRIAQLIEHLESL